jgi:hypothetical protein
MPDEELATIEKLYRSLKTSRERSDSGKTPGIVFGVASSADDLAI